MPRAKSPPGTGPRYEYSRAYYVANREKVEAKKREYRAANREKVNAYARDYMKKNPASRSKRRGWYATNRHAIKVARSCGVSLPAARVMVNAVANGPLAAVNRAVVEVMRSYDVPLATAVETVRLWAVGRGP